MKTGDIGNTLSFTIKDRDGTVVNLTNFTAATLRWKADGATVVEKAMSFAADRTTGIVTYTTTTGDLTSPGIYDMEIKLTYPGGLVFYSVNSMREQVEAVMT